MSVSAGSKRKSTSYCKAENRSDAVKKMISPDPLLATLYQEGKARDGKSGWVNAIRDQREQIYRLLFYVGKIPLAPEFRQLDEYEVLYGPINPADDSLDETEINFPRVLFTTTGAINLMRDGLPNQRFVDALRRGILQIVPFELGRDVRTESLRNSGYTFLAIYDRDGHGIRILDLLEWSMVYDSREHNEVQVHHDESLVIGDTKFVRPFLMKFASNQETADPDTKTAAQQKLNEL